MEGLLINMVSSIGKSKEVTAEREDSYCDNPYCLVDDCDGGCECI